MIQHGLVVFTRKSQDKKFRAFIREGKIIKIFPSLDPFMKFQDLTLEKFYEWVAKKEITIIEEKEFPVKKI